ncbi:hypothetical protein PR202_ga20103 [Eleusine coracana subsp. coracana]|uniref:Uncharacterized protein n=1 Tax=Eleusine coracana subsp. coracana TaxID=191504 RepID=A0AAV5CWI1_ELECO|nr:hypothetical protein QOZ80_4AG0315210 [Eleusine coracana subsp. coracana]GJN02724.1 hypothetical protein PR202_ga20103 [Eleusine coracana subsp. coracana]
MASMISGDFVEAYVLKNACKEKMKRAEAAGAQEKKQHDAGDATSGKQTAEEAEGSGKSDGSGFLGFNKKVHPEVGGASS